MNKVEYDCDTRIYWCSEEDYRPNFKTFGEFTADGSGYRITNANTPRPWLNYFANPRFGAVLSNTAMGFCWYKTTLVRITRYEHPIDYLPRDFKDGRKILVKDLDSGESASLFDIRPTLTCTHYCGHSVISVTALGLEFEFTFFVPLLEPCEVWLLKVNNPGTEKRRLLLEFSQIWSFAKFGSHTAEEGIPYVSAPGENMEISAATGSITCTAASPELPWKLHGGFFSPEASAEIEPLIEQHSNGKTFTFHRCILSRKNIELDPGKHTQIPVYSVAGGDANEIDGLRQSANLAHAAKELDKVRRQWQEYHDRLSCELPHRGIRDFLNYWLKNQLHLTFHFVRSGHWGYRDAFQDAWGYTLLDPEAAEKRIKFMISGMLSDGTAPRQLTKFEDGIHDMRRYLDSPVWAARTLVDLIKETGNKNFLDEKTPFLDGGEATVLEHVSLALDYLYEHRGTNGGCLTGDGDWNDALEGISRDGDAESFWLTIALYDAVRLMRELYLWLGNDQEAGRMRKRAETLSKVVNTKGWDGEWYIYGMTGKGEPIGSKRNREGRIHLNPQSWAVFSGLADERRTANAIESVEKYLETPFGPALLAPPYALDAKDVGRIAKLEPGTFENGSVYQHAAAFYILALFRAGKADKAVGCLERLLPSNPENHASRRTSEPYCTGNFYCGPGHPRAGQNFFTWFTGNASWLLRIGFDEMLGVKAGFDGLEINPKLPSGWNEIQVRRKYRECIYQLHFKRQPGIEKLIITIEGNPLPGNIIPPLKQDAAEVTISFR